MAFTFQDGKKLWSLVWHNEEVLNKKRRWLTGPPTLCTSEGSQKRPKRPKFLTNELLTQSYIRSDEVSYFSLVSPEIVRTNVEKSFGSFSNNQGKHHVVQNYLQFFDICDTNSYSTRRSTFLKSFYSIINDLNNGALCHVTNLVTNNKVSFAKIRPRMKKIIKFYLPRIFAELNHGDCLTPLKHLSQIFRDPSNFREKQLSLLTPISPSLLSSIQKVMEGLDEMPFQDIAAMNRKLKDITLIPQFPPVLPTCKRDLLIGRVRKKCLKVVSSLREGDDLPKPFAKALSVMCLSLKQKTRCVDILTSEFYPFSPEIVGLQNDILKALWLLPKVKIVELIALQHLVDPEAKVSRKTFRTTLRKYLIEYLFECDVIDIPKEVLNILATINKISQRQPRLYTVAMVDEEVEAVLNMSSQLKQIVSNLLPDNKSDSMSELESDDGNESNDFEISENDYCSNRSNHDEHDQQSYRSYLNDEARTTGDSRAVTYSANQRYSLQLSEHYLIGSFIRKHHKLEQSDFMPVTNNHNYLPQLPEAYSIGDFIKKKPKLEHEDDLNSTQNYQEEATELQSKDDVQETGHIREILIKEICDETSLVAYRLIGHVLDRFLQIEGKDADEMTRYYLRGGSSPSLDCPGTEGSLKTSKEDVGAQILIQAAEELLPTMPKSCIERVKKLMGKPPL